VEGCCQKEGQGLAAVAYEVKDATCPEEEAVHWKEETKMLLHDAYNFGGDGRIGVPIRKVAYVVHVNWQSLCLGQKI